MPSGSGGVVVDVRVFNRHGIEKDERSITIERSEIDSVQQDKIVEEEILERSIKQSASQILSGSTINKKSKTFEVGEKISADKIESASISEIFKLSINDNKKEEALNQLKDQFNKANLDIQERFEDKVLKLDKVTTFYQV